MSSGAIYFFPSHVCAQLCRSTTVPGSCISTNIDCHDWLYSLVSGTVCHVHDVYVESCRSTSGSPTLRDLHTLHCTRSRSTSPAHDCIFVDCDSMQMYKHWKHKPTVCGQDAVPGEGFYSGERQEVEIEKPFQLGHVTLSVRYRRERFSTNGLKRRARLVLEKWAAFIAILFEEVNWVFFLQCSSVGKDRCEWRSRFIAFHCLTQVTVSYRSLNAP